MKTRFVFCALLFVLFLSKVGAFVGSFLEMVWPPADPNVEELMFLDATEYVMCRYIPPVCVAKD